VPHRFDPEHLRTFAEHANDLLAVASTEDYFLKVNPVWVKLLGYSAEELLSRPFIEFVHPEDKERTVRELGRLEDRDGYAARNFVNRYLSADGEVVFLEWQSNVPMGDGVVYALARDVSDRMRALERLREREERIARQERFLALAEETARFGTWRLDISERELTWSDEMYRIHGVDRATFNPSVDRAENAYRERAYVQDAISNCIAHGTPFDIETELEHPDGARRLLRTRGRAELDDKGKPRAVIGVVQDMTEERELVRRLSDSERLASVGTLAAGIAHEINNPLQFMVTNLEFAQQEIDELSGGSPQGAMKTLLEVIDETMDGARRVGRIVRGLQAFARPDPGVDEVVALSGVLDAAIKLSRHELDHRAELVLDTRTSAKVRGSETELTQVVVNLLVNAAQALDGSDADAGRIALRVEHDDTHVAIEIEDNGPGIAPADRPRIFDPFFTTKPVGVGTGLGLAICHGIVARHGGELSVESQPGRTVFRLALPLEEATDDTREHAPARPRKTIVLIDDDERLLRSFSRLLGMTYDVLTATSASEALQLLRTSPAPFAILCDVMMPEGTGVHFLEALQNDLPHLEQRLLFLTGGAFTPATRKLVEETQRPVLSKPIDHETLEVALADLERSIVDQPLEPRAKDS
jgi:PAS domain S-box-containing protein